MSQGVTRFRTSFTYVEGNVPAQMLQGKIVNVNMVNWTVDVASDFDRKRYFDIQVSSPYLHYSNGEGLSAFPEVGAKCIVCLPSDSSPPFVSAFVMPPETVDMAAPDAPKGAMPRTSDGDSSSGVSFSGGRPKVKPGDIWLRTRDDNFVVLHRGGVLQIGATELAQRIYIPLRHHIMDISQNYVHHNAGGSEFWGLQEGPALSHYPTENWKTYRVYADNKFADIRVKVGKFLDFVPEPTGDAGNQSDIDLLHLGQGDDYIVTEVVIAPNGFNPETGSVSSSNTRNQTVLRFFFDRAGGVFFRAKGNVLLSTKKRLVVRATEGIEMASKKELVMTGKDGAILDGGAYTFIKGGTVKLGPGKSAVAHQGSIVKLTLPPLIAITTNGPAPVQDATTGSPIITAYGIIASNCSATVFT